MQKDCHHVNRDNYRVTENSHRVAEKFEKSYCLQGQLLREDHFWCKNRKVGKNRNDLSTDI